MIYLDTIIEEYAPCEEKCKTRCFACAIYSSILPPPFRSSLQSVRDSISNQVSAVFQLYEENTDSLDLLTVTERSVTTPSLSDMLEWLQDAERHYREQYPFCSCSFCVGFSFYSGPCIPKLMFRFLRRKTLLQTLRADNLSLLESAPKRWKSFESPSAEDRITGIIHFTDMSLSSNN